MACSLATDQCEPASLPGRAAVTSGLSPSVRFGPSFGPTGLPGSTMGLAGVIVCEVSSRVFSMEGSRLPAVAEVGGEEEEEEEEDMEALVMRRCSSLNMKRATVAKVNSSFLSIDSAILVVSYEGGKENIQCCTGSRRGSRAA